jgi:hypothetical protein
VEEVSLMNRLVLVLALSMVVAGLSTAAEPEILLPGPGGNPGGYDREVLWLDNPDFSANTGSSEIIGEFALETEIANDFILEVDATVRKVTWWGTYWNGYEGIPTGAGFNMRFYYDAGCLPEVSPYLEYLLPEDDCCETLAWGGDQYAQYVYEGPFDIAQPLPAGLYWFSVQMADHSFPPQWGRLGADMTQICDSAFRSEYFAYPEWVPAPDVFGDLYDASQMFEDEYLPTATEDASWGAVKALFR